jgi:hypothetical protein
MATQPRKSAAKKSVAKKSAAKKSAAKTAAPSTTAARKAAGSARKSASGATTARRSDPVSSATATNDSAASTVTDRPPDSAPVQVAGPVLQDTPEAVAARETLHGRKKWGTGSDRDANLRKAGLDPRVVARERNRLRHEERYAQG